jgi:hypothetical protein
MRPLGAGEERRVTSNASPADALALKGGRRTAVIAPAAVRKNERRRMNNFCGYARSFSFTRFEAVPFQPTGRQACSAQ